MVPDKLVQQRFRELAEKADAVLAAKYPDPCSVSRTVFYNVPLPMVTEWAVGVMNLLRRVFGEESDHYKQFTGEYGSGVDSESGFRVIRAVFDAAREDYEGRYLFNVQSLIKAEVFDDSLEQARELLRAGYKDPACVVAGVTLETALKELCDRNNVPHAKLDKMNADLCKAGVYNMPMQKMITAWADLRNKAAHGEGHQFTDKDVEDMINGVNRFVAERV